MPIRREFLDWRQPALAGAAEFLRGRHERDGQWDLGGVVVVVPGGRAGRRLLEILVSVAEERQTELTPPEIVTPEGLPELLYQAKWPFADELTQQLAWARALRAAPADVLAAFLPFPPEADDTSRWLAVGETLRRLHLELAGDGLDCGQVLKRAGDVEGFAEHGRWRALCELQRLYLHTLDELKLWDVQTARLVAIEKREIGTDREIVLVGTVDLNRAQRQMLDQIADRVTALVIAPRELAERFDEQGCLLPAKWTEAVLPLTDEQIERVDGPAEQAETVTRWLAALGGKYRADEIAIGLPDDRLAPQIERQLAQIGLIGRAAVGKHVSQTGPYRLLQVAADYGARRRFRDMAGLVRHPDVYEWLTDRRLKGRKIVFNPLTALDEFAGERFPAHLDAERLAKDEKAADVLAICRAVEALVEPLIQEPKRRRLADWAEPLRRVLQEVYGDMPLDRNRPEDRCLLKALEFVGRALDGLARVPVSLQPAVDARQASRMVLAEVAGEGIPPPPEADAIELLGWLDLPLDDAPATLVTTFNEGWVPSATTADAFLPNRLREALGLLHNDRRLARDAYALSLLCASRRELRVLVAHRDSEGNPLAPSRLLFLTDEEGVVARARRFFNVLPPQPPRRNLLLPPGGAVKQSKIVPPRPERLKEPITALSVTKFRDYIACPYRFYLRHVLELRAVDDQADELDGGTFGGVAHWVLEQFGRADEARAVREQVDPAAIAEYLDAKLDQFAAARFGKQLARPAVLVQVEQMRLRLRQFAKWQAERTRDGWRIVFVEDSESERVLTARIDVDGKPFTLRGRIDRIDYHQKLRRLAVLDYKTADRGDGPKQTHRRGDEWIDLQLPLYRHLVRAAKFTAKVPTDAQIELGYIVLPLNLKCVGLLPADWDDALLLSADLKAQEVVRRVREERFWPPATTPPEYGDDVAAICQDRRMGGRGFEGAEDAA